MTDDKPEPCIGMQPVTYRPLPSTSSENRQTADQTTTIRPKISVLVPSYQSARFLREALESALHQVPPPHEVVVQDGGSNDGTLDILRSFGDRVMWASGPDQGQADALNLVLARSTGDVVVWLNADDILLPGSIEAATSVFSIYPNLAFAYGDFEMIDASGTVIRSYRSNPYSWNRAFRRGCYIFSGSIFIRRHTLLDIGGFDNELTACMDLDLLLRLGSTGQSIQLPLPIAQFRFHDASKSSTIGSQFLREAFRIRRRYVGFSLRLWLIALQALARDSILSALAPLRYSSLWPRHKRSKTL